MGKIIKLGASSKRMGVSPTPLHTWMKKNKVQYVTTPTGHQLNIC